MDKARILGPSVRRHCGDDSRLQLGRLGNRRRGSADGCGTNKNRSRKGACSNLSRAVENGPCAQKEARGDRKRAVVWKRGRRVNGGYRMGNNARLQKGSSRAWRG